MQTHETLQTTGRLQLSLDKHYVSDIWGGRPQLPATMHGNQNVRLWQCCGKGKAQDTNETACRSKTYRPNAFWTLWDGRLPERSKLSEPSKLSQLSKQSKRSKVSELSKLRNPSKQSRPSKLSKIRKQAKLNKISEQSKQSKRGEQSK